MKLQRILNLHNISSKDYDIFIETGTYRGDNLADLHRANFFNNINRVYSIEINSHFIDVTKERFPYLKESKYDFILGDSSIELEKLIDKHNEDKIIFWLDAHFSGGLTGKSNIYGECPLLGELKHLEKLQKKPLVIIDDISFFYIPPPQSYHKKNDWPKMDDILKIFEESKFDFKITIENNKIVYLIAE